MKKLLPILLLALLWVVPSCDDGGDDDDDKSSTSQLTVTVNYLGEYNGDYDTIKAGTKINYVSLYSYAPDTLPADLDDMDPDLYNVYELDGNGDPTNINGIPAGDYYLIACYDYRSGSDTLNQADRYAIYNGTGGTGSPLTSEAQKLTITASGPHEVIFNIQPFWEMGEDKIFLTSLAGNTLNVTFTDPGVPDTGDGNNYIHAFVYRQLESTSPRYNILYKGSIDATSGTVTIGNILKGSYYVLLLVDYDEGDNTINRNDYYELYDDVSSPTGSPTPVTFSATGGTETISDDDGMTSFQLQSQATWYIP